MFESNYLLSTRSIEVPGLIFKDLLLVLFRKKQPPNYKPTHPEGLFITADLQIQSKQELDTILHNYLNGTKAALTFIFNHVNPT